MPRSRLLLYGLLALVMLLIVQPYSLMQPARALPEGDTYDNPSSPVDLLASYYNAINARDYARAYAYWEKAPQTYNAFAAGFAQTASVQVIVQPPTRIEGAAGSLYAQIPTVLLASLSNGTPQMFAGCFTVRRSNLTEPTSAAPVVWRLYSAEVEQVQNNPAAIPNLLAQVCAP